MACLPVDVKSVGVAHRDLLSSMLSLSGFAAGHSSYIHDLAYDWYGRRLATASADQRIRIFQLQPTQHQEGEWEEWGCIANILAHNGPVLRLSWSHPEFGALLASCAADRSVHIYQQSTTSTISNINPTLPPQGTAAQSLSTSYRRIARISDARDGVTCLTFSPRHHGLKLTTASLDGTVYTYESTDIINLGVWQLVEEFDIRSAMESGSGAAANAGTTTNLAMLHRFNPTTAANHQIHSIAYNQSAFDPPMLAVSSGDHSAWVWMSMSAAQQQRNQPARTSTYSTTSSNVWQAVCELSGHTDVVNDVAWAPQMGRSYHLIGTACKDGAVRIYKLYMQPANQTANSPQTVTADLVARLPEHHTAVWRLSWNVTGTILCSSGDDGAARLWKQDFGGRWQQMITANPSSTESVAMQNPPTVQHNGLGNGTSSNSYTSTHQIPV